MRLPSDGTPTAKATGVPVISKSTFLLRLIGICAGVNDFIAEQQKKPEGVQPGLVADRLEQLIGAAVANAPNVDRDKLDEMVAQLGTFVRALRDQQDTTPADEEQKAETAKAVEEAQAAADQAAVRYGMPHLNECNMHMQPWQELGTLPTSVQQGATAVVNGRIWVAGGLTGDGAPTDRTFYYDPVVGSWFTGPALPMALNHAMAVDYHNELVVIGGWVPDGNKILGTASREVLRLHGDSWGRLPPLLKARGAGGAAVVGDRIVVVGGDDNGPVAQTEVFDGSTWQERAPIPVEGDHLAAVSDGKAVYVVGGRRHFDASQSTAALQRFDPEANQWTQLATMQAPRGGLGAAYVDGRIYAVGGETANSSQDVVEVYDIAGNTWTPATSLPEGSHGLGVAAWGDTLYAIGGATEAGHSNSTDAVTGLSLTATSSPTGSATTAPSASPRASPSPSTVPTIIASTSDSSALSDCPDKSATHWACLSSVRLRMDGGLDIRYKTNFGPSAKLDPAHQHLHVFTARPDGEGGTTPPAATMRSDAGDRQGSWVNLYLRDVTVIPAGAKTGGKHKPLDTKAPLLCIRVASGYHSLAKDRAGGWHTGNCVSIKP